MIDVDRSLPQGNQHCKIMLKQRQLQTGWLKLRLKNIESYIDFNVILQWEFCRYF